MFCSNSEGEGVNLQIRLKRGCPTLSDSDSEGYDSRALEGGFEKVWYCEGYGEGFKKGFTILCSGLQIHILLRLSKSWCDIL